MPPHSSESKVKAKSARRRKAEFVANLVIIDEPQLVAMKAGKSQVIAVAVPEGSVDGADFVAATVTEKNWRRYLGGYVDLRYLFTYPFQRSLYHFPNTAWLGNSVYMTPFEGDLPSSALPESGFFSRDHTEEFAAEEKAKGREKLFIDGEWGLDEFGSFYQKYSDVYSFLAVLDNFGDPNFSHVLRGRSISAFQNRPYKGGSSYLHVFSDLDGCLPRDQRLGLDGIVYNSPGDVRINGEQEYLAEIEVAVSKAIVARTALRNMYKELHDYLSRLGLLKESAARYDINGVYDKPIGEMAERLAKEMSVSEQQFGSLVTLCGNNNLVVAKVVLAVFRRLEAASMFFAEGRMAFEKP